MAKVFHMHFICPMAAGPIVSDGGPQLAPEVAGELGRERVGRPGKYGIACNPALQLGVEHRATDKPYLVGCPECKATDAYKAVAHILHPTVQAAIDQQAEADACCE